MLAEERGITDVSSLCVALLHDTIEDTQTTVDVLTREFCAEVAGTVAEVTDDKSLVKAERKCLHVEHAAHISPQAQQVKLADKIANLRDVAGSPPAGLTLERRREHSVWAKAVTDRLRGVDARLEAVFDKAYSARPRRAGWRTP